MQLGLVPDKRAGSQLQINLCCVHRNLEMALKKQAEWVREREKRQHKKACSKREATGDIVARVAAPNDAEINLNSPYLSRTLKFQP